MTNFPAIIPKYRREKNVFHGIVSIRFTVFTDTSSFGVSKQNEHVPLVFERNGKEREIEKIEIDDLDESHNSKWNNIFVVGREIVFYISMQNEPVFSMNNDLLNNTRTIHLDYGDVEVGKVAVKTIDVWNESCVSNFCYLISCKMGKKAGK